MPSSQVKTGVDKRGRKYKTVGGKHVALDAQNPVAKKPTNPIRNLMRRWFGKTQPGQTSAGSIEKLLHSPFKMWFSIIAKTSVGKTNRLKMARALMKQLNDDTPVRKFMRNGDLDYQKFAEHLKQKHGIDAPEAPAEQETPEQKNNDAELLRICHEAGLTPESLRALVSQKPATSAP